MKRQIIYYSVMLIIWSCLLALSLSTNSTKSAALDAFFVGANFIRLFLVLDGKAIE